MITAYHIVFFFNFFLYYIVIHIIKNVYIFTLNNPKFCKTENIIKNINIYFIFWKNIFNFIQSHSTMIYVQDFNFIYISD